MALKPEQDWCEQIDAPSHFDFVSALPAPCSGNWEPTPFTLREPPGAQAAANAFFEKRAQQPDEPPLKDDRPQLIDLRLPIEPVHRHRPTTSFQQFITSYYSDSPPHPHPLSPPRDWTSPRPTPRRVVSVNCDLPTRFDHESNPASRTPGNSRPTTPARRARSTVVARALFAPSPVRPPNPSASPRAHRGLSYHRPRPSPSVSPPDTLASVHAAPLLQEASRQHSNSTSAAPRRRVSPGLHSSSGSRASTSQSSAGSLPSRGALTKSKPRVCVDAPAPSGNKTVLPHASRLPPSDLQSSVTNSTSESQQISQYSAEDSSDQLVTTAKVISPEPKIKRPRRVGLPQRVFPFVEDTNKHVPPVNATRQVPLESSRRLDNSNHESTNPQRPALSDQSLRGFEARTRNERTEPKAANSLDDILQSENARILQERQRRGLQRQQMLLAEKENVLRSFPVKETRVIKKKRTTARVEFTSANSRRKASTQSTEENRCAVPAVLNVTMSPSAQESQPSSNRGLRGLRTRTRALTSHGTKEERVTPRSASDLDSAAATFGQMSLTERVKASVKEKRRLKKVEGDLNSLLNQHNSRVQNNRNRRLAAKQ